MGQISSKLRNLEGGKLAYWCQGCEMLHAVGVGEGPGPRWGFNGNLERPTFEPSVNTRWDTRSEAARARAEAFKQEHGRHPTLEEVPSDAKHICHTFIRDGRVQFLGDCTHQFAGQTLDLPDLPTEWRDGS